MEVASAIRKGDNGMSKTMEYGQRFAFADVLAATRKLAVEAGSTDATSVTRAVITAVGFNTADRDNYIGARSAWDRLCDQVKRALDKLADESVLVKAGRGEEGPGGNRSGIDSARYWTPDRYVAEAREARNQAEAAAGVAEAWQAVNRELAARGYYGTGDAGEAPRLSLATWQSLVGRMNQLGM